jgi:predicted  nucleic acid-binding Zn-ribbon protein
MGGEQKIDPAVMDQLIEAAQKLIDRNKAHIHSLQMEVEALEKETGRQEQVLELARTKLAEMRGDGGAQQKTECA